MWHAIQRYARRTRPYSMISLTTQLAVDAGTEKERFCAPAMIAVLMPTTREQESTRGPPELPGLSATSVWMIPSIIFPSFARSDRPSAETTPAETVDWKPSGLL